MTIHSIKTSILLIKKISLWFVITSNQCKMGIIDSKVNRFYLIAKIIIMLIMSSRDPIENNLLKLTKFNILIMTIKNIMILIIIDFKIHFRF